MYRRDQDRWSHLNKFVDATQGGVTPQDAPHSLSNRLPTPRPVRRGPEGAWAIKGLEAPPFSTATTETRHGDIEATSCSGRRPHD